jgi:hypothetical protein
LGFLTDFCRFWFKNWENSIFQCKNSTTSAKFCEQFAKFSISPEINFKKEEEKALFGRGNNWQKQRVPFAFS